MRQDQYERLQALNERLTDVFLTEGDPEGWPGAGKGPAELTKDERGDRYWCKKNAFATVSLIQRVGTLVAIIQSDSNRGHGAAEVHEGEAELDAEVASAEAEAARLLDDVMAKSRKQAFDRKVHGRKA